MNDAPLDLDDLQAALLLVAPASMSVAVVALVAAARELAATRAVVAEQAATITTAAGEVEALRAELAKVKMRLRDICNALGVAEMFHDCIDPVSIEMQMHQLQQGLDLQNSAARIFQPPDDLTPDQFIPWVKARGKEWKALCAELAAVKAERDEARHIHENLTQMTNRQIEELHASCDALRKALEGAGRAIMYADECFEAALCEGLIDAFADNDGERLHDLWSCRLSFARDKFPDALAAIQKALT